jgi:predicted Zn finger-like uncharacterized protein
MIVTCPNCATHFKVPEGALGTKGRSMKCARCGHLWRAMPEAGPGDIPLESPSDIPPSLPRDEVTERMFSENNTDGDLALAEIDAGGFSGEGTDSVEEDDPFAEMSKLMRARKPETMADIVKRPPKPAPRPKGGLILWVVVLAVLLVGAAWGLYGFQDHLIDQWPALEKYYERAGVREAAIGHGLSFRNTSDERATQDNTEVVIIQGVIANDTDHRRTIPLMRLALFNGKAQLQEKIITPPQAALEGHATVGFRITLEQPDPNATRFELTFVAAK